jgi:hypothetical protein
MTDHEPARDVMAERFDRMEGLLRGYDVADAFITALAHAGYVIVRESELERSFLAGMHHMRPRSKAPVGRAEPEPQ